MEESEGNNDSVKTFKTQDGFTVYLENFREINPAQDFAEGIAFITQTLWHDKPVFDSKRNFLGTVKDKGIFVITSDKRIINIGSSIYQFKNLLMTVPDTAPDNRFSAKMIEKFLTQDIDFNPLEVFKEIIGQYRKHLDIDHIPGAYTVNAIYDILSYFTWLFTSVPYLWFNGNTSAGKSKGCSIHEQLGFNAFMSVNETPATLFRTIRDTRGMFIIDEAENQGNTGQNSSESQLAREQILNSGYKRNGKTSRVERGSYSNLQRVVYPTFGPKVIGGISQISETLRNRSYKILMLKTIKEEIANTSVKDDDLVWQDLRDKLYVIMLNHWTEILDLIDRGEVSNKHKFDDGTELTLIGRDWEKAEPILTIGYWLSNYAKDKESLVNEIWDFLKYQRGIEEEAVLGTLDSNIIGAIDEKFSKDGSPMELREISSIVAYKEGIDTSSPKFNLTRYSKTIKDRSEKLGIVKKFKHGAHNIVYLETDRELIEATKSRYKLNVTSVDNPDNPDNLDNLNNLDNLFDTFSSLLNELLSSNTENFSETDKKSLKEIIDKLTLLKSKVNGRLSTKVIEKFAVIREEVIGLSRLSSGVTSEGNSKPNIEDIKKELKETLFLSGGIMSIKIFYDLFKERFAELPEAEVNKIFKDLTESGEFNFDFNTQVVSLEDAEHG